MKIFTTLFLLLSWATAGAFSTDSLPGKLNGTICPDFTYVDVNGKSISLRDLRGKYVLIDMWGTWCVPCQKQLPFLKELEEEFSKDNIVFVSIAHEHKGDKSGEKWKAQVKRDQLGGVQLLATDKKFAAAIGLTSFPTFLLIAPDGRILSSDFYRPSDWECRYVLLELLRGEKGCDFSQTFQVSTSFLQNFFSGYLYENDGKTMVHLSRQPLLERNMDATASSSRMAIHRKGWRESYPSQWSFVHLKTVLIDLITQQMLAIRAKELTQESASNLRFQFSCSDFAPGFISYTIAAESTDKMDEVKTYRTLLLAQEQLLRYGFVKTELEEAKKIFLQQLEGKKIQHPTAEMDACQQAIKQILPYITVADAWNILKYWEKMSAPEIVVSGREGLTTLTQEEAVAIFRSRGKENVDSYKQKAKSHTLLDPSALKGSPVVSERWREEMKATEWELGNGARIIFRREALDPGDLSFYAVSPGGYSLYEPEMLPALRDGINFTQKRFGVADMDAEALARANSGRVALLQFAVSELYETINGATSVKDGEHLLQLLYLYFTNPRFDAKVLAEIIKHNREMLPNRNQSLASFAADTIKHILGGYSPRIQTLSEEYLDLLTLDKIEKGFRERFSNASDFTFYFVGNMEEFEMKKLVEKYIGSIPGTGRQEQWLDRGVRPLRGKVRQTILLPREAPLASLLIEYHREMKITPKEQLIHRILATILSERMTATAHQQGNLPTISVNARSEREPYGYYQYSMRMNCDSLKMEELKQLIYKEMERIQVEEVTPEELWRVVSAMCASKDSERRPVFHIQIAMNLMEQDKNGIDPLDPTYFDEILKELTPKELRSFARKMLKKADVTELTFQPLHKIEKARFHKLSDKFPAEQLIMAIAGGFPGQMLLIDTWGTWCGSCFLAMKEMKMVKEKLQKEGKNYTYIYLADESSPLEKWEESAKSIPGEHFRLTKEQFDALRELYNIPGAPGFLIVNRKGEVVWHSVGGFPGAESMRNAMLEHWEN